MQITMIHDVVSPPDVSAAGWGCDIFQEEKQKSIHNDIQHPMVFTEKASNQSRKP